MPKEITIYHLEMKSISDLNEKCDSNGLSVIEVEIDEFRFNKFLYQYIGEPWEWTDKLNQSDSEWEAYVKSPYLRTWVAYFRGAISGYFELLTKGGTTEIAYFGLALPFIGKGFGSYLLSQAIKQAWNIKSTERVYVHTCTLDHSSALSNYKARGFKVYKTESA